MKEKKKMKKGGIWRILYPYLTLYGVNIVVGTIAGMICIAGIAGEKGIDFITQLATDEEGLLQLMNQLTLYLTENNNLLEIFIAAVAVPIMLIYMRMDRRRLYQEEEYVTYCPPKAVQLIFPFVLGICAAVTFNNLLNLSGLMEKYYSDVETMADAVYSGGILLEIIALVIVAPVMEEMCFRGLVYRRCREIMTVIPSMLVTSLIFGYFHGNLIQGIYGFGIGMLCAFVMERYKSLPAAILVHMGANLTSVILSETEILSGIDTDTEVIIYMGVFAVGTVLALAYIHDKVEARVLIPAGKDAENADSGEGERGETNV